MQSELADFRYCEPKAWGAKGLRQAIRSTPHDVMILNGFFDREFTIPALLMRRLGLIPRRPTILSPRGEFSAGAAAIAKVHKQLYLTLTRRLGLLDDVCLHATGADEAGDIRRHCPWAKKIIVAPNIRMLGADRPQQPMEGVSGRPLRLVFLSRIDRKKNLHYALKVLHAAGFPVEFDIYGPISDAPYWRSCQSIIANLPANIAVQYHGVIPNIDVPETLARYDAFFLPTAGENFGHAIFDALAAGLPVLISDQTPWRNLEKQRAGWSLPLDNADAFAQALLTLRAMNADQRRALTHGARGLAERSILENDAVSRSRDMLKSAMLNRKDRSSARGAGDGA